MQWLSYLSSKSALGHCRTLMTSHRPRCREVTKSGNREGSFTAKILKYLPPNLQNHFLPGSLPCSWAVIRQVYKLGNVVSRFQGLPALRNACCPQFLLHLHLLLPIPHYFLQRYHVFTKCAIILWCISQSTAKVSHFISFLVLSKIIKFIHIFFEIWVLFSCLHLLA